MIRQFANLGCPPVLPAATESQSESSSSSSSSSSPPCMDAEMLNIGEYLFVDDLLEFSNDDIAGPIESSITTTLHEFPALPCYDSCTLLPSPAAGGDVCSLTSSEGPEMDWLSNLHDEVEGVEDEQGIACGLFKIGAKLSGRQFPASYNNNSNNDNNNHNTSSVSNRSDSNGMISEDPWHVPALTQIVRAGSAGKAARSKRSRGSNYAGGWTVSSSNSSLLESVADSSRGSLDSDVLTDLSSTSNTFCQSEIVNLIRPSITPLQNNIPASNLPPTPPSADDDHQHQKKKSSKKISRENKALADDSGRRCTHCQSQKTPQWRLGPAGPKTLCNACGVRFKSGRLFPEYRPANSPTFISHRHSNSHRKVLEMRKHKGLPPLLGVALPSPVARFKAATISGMDSSWTIQNSTKLPKRKQASVSSSDSSSAAVFNEDGHGDEYDDNGDYNEEEDAETEEEEDDEEEEEEAC